MARLNDDAQWIILIGFIVSFSLFFLAMVINQSTVVGQTTSESIIEFPKNDIRDIREVIGESVKSNQLPKIKEDIAAISLQRKSAVVWYENDTGINPTTIEIHYNNGVTAYNETWTY